MQPDPPCLTADASHRSAWQFSLRWLFGLMVAAAMLFALPPEVYRVAFLVVHAVALVALPLVAILVPVGLLVYLEEYLLAYADEDQADQWPASRQ